MDICLAGARAEASRRNGAKSRGPNTPDGKARSSRNVLKHGLRTRKFVVVGGESAEAFAALESALDAELAPEGALQGLLARRIARAAWRLERAERLEAELFAENHLADRSLGLALIRDCNGARSFDTLLRYRGGMLAEFSRAAHPQGAQGQWEARSEPVVPEPRLTYRSLTNRSEMRHPCAMPSHAKYRSNPRAAQILAIQAGQAIGPRPVATSSARAGLLRCCATRPRPCEAE